MVKYFVFQVKSDVKVDDENRKYARALADASSTEEEKAEAFDYFVGWVASHPEDLSPDEINRYDSEQDARAWALEHAEDVVEVLDRDWVRCEVYYIEDFEVDEDDEIDYNYCGDVDYGFNNPYRRG